MTKADKKSLIATLFIVAVDNFGYGVVLVMFAPFLLDPGYHLVPSETSIAMRNLYLGILLISYPLVQFVAAPLFGDFADIAGRKKALIFSLLGGAISFLLSGVALLFSSLTALIITRLISGFFLR